LPEQENRPRYEFIERRLRIVVLGDEFNRRIQTINAMTKA